MMLTRKYIQFNDLVIDNFDMLSSADLSGSFKVNPMEYSYGHGSYAPFKFGRQFSGEQSLSMTLKLDIRKLSCDQVEHYKDYVLLNLVKPGRIWAIQGKQLLWATAYVRDYSEAYVLEKYTLSIDVDFGLPEGIWHKADVRKVFLKPYDLCNYLDCEDFREVDNGLDCCVSCAVPKTNSCRRCECGCEALTKEYAFGTMKEEAVNDFYRLCGNNYRIIYNCEAGRRIWGDEAMLGERICKEDTCVGIVAGQFYSDTILESEGVTVTIKGKVKNPMLTVNGNSIQIMGEYDGILTITANGEAYFQNTECCEKDLIDLEKTKIPPYSTLGFLAHHGDNAVTLETNDCCSMTCVYVKVDSITI